MQVLLFQPHSLTLIAHNTTQSIHRHRSVYVYALQKEYKLERLQQSSGGFRNELRRVCIEKTVNQLLLGAGAVQVNFWNTATVYYCEVKRQNWVEEEMVG